MYALGMVFFVSLGAWMDRTEKKIRALEERVTGSGSEQTPR